MGGANDDTPDDLLGHIPALVDACRDRPLSLEQRFAVVVLRKHLVRWCRRLVVERRAQLDGVLSPDGVEEIALSTARHLGTFAREVREVVLRVLERAQRCGGLTEEAARLIDDYSEVLAHRVVFGLLSVVEEDTGPAWRRLDESTCRLDAGAIGALVEEHRCRLEEELRQGQADVSRCLLELQDLELARWHGRNRARKGERYRRSLLETVCEEARRLAIMRVLRLRGRYSDEPLAIASRVFVRVSEGILGYEGTGSASAWLGAIVKNETIKHLKEESGREIAILDRGFDDGAEREEPQIAGPSSEQPDRPLELEERRSVLLEAVGLEEILDEDEAAPDGASEEQIWDRLWLDREYHGMSYRRLTRKWAAVLEARADAPKTKDKPLTDDPITWRAGVTRPPTAIRKVLDRWAACMPVGQALLDDLLEMALAARSFEERFAPDDRSASLGAVVEARGSANVAELRRALARWLGEIRDQADAENYLTVKLGRHRKRTIVGRMSASWATTFERCRDELASGGAFSRLVARLVGPALLRSRKTGGTHTPALRYLAGEALLEEPWLMRALEATAIEEAGLRLPYRVEGWAKGESSWPIEDEGLADLADGLADELIAGRAPSEVGTAARATIARHLDVGEGAMPLAFAERLPGAAAGLTRALSEAPLVEVFLGGAERSALVEQLAKVSTRAPEGLEVTEGHANELRERCFDLARRRAVETLAGHVAPDDPGPGGAAAGRLWRACWGGE